jgi:glucosyl-3-phosphoglycerate phosphatase
VSAVRRVWLVRHGETEGQSSIRFHGTNDVCLSDEGRAQIAALAPLLAHVPFVRVLHSPLARAAESARILIERLALGVVTEADPRLGEIHFGECEGLTRTEIAARFPAFWADYEAGRTDAFPGGESRRAFGERVAAAIHELVAAPATVPTHDVLVVAHRGTVREAVRALLGPAVPPAPVLGVGLATITVLHRPLAPPDAPWQLEALGLAP